MVRMERLVYLLNLELHDLEVACRAWCTDEGLEFTTGARLAHYILKPINPISSRTPPPDDILPRPAEDEAAWRALSEWRHPQLNLNLLQLAIVFESEYLQEYLWQPVFLQEQEYKDDSSQLVNHPLHLHYRFRGVREINLDYIRDELFYEEGLIDLTPSRILTHTLSSLAASGLPNASVLESDSSPHFHSAVETMTDDLTRSVNRRLLRQPESVRMTPLYDFSHLLNVGRKLSGTQARPSTVELVWTIANNAAGDGFESLFPGIHYSAEVPPSHKQELLILLCQCTFTVTDAKLREKRLDDLSMLFWMLSGGHEVQTEKAVRFLSTNALEKTIRLLQKLEARHSLLGIKCPKPPASEVLKHQLGCKSLLDLCVLTILEAVKGDARKVWSLEQLPEPLKQLFHIPFQKRYEELKAEEK